MNADEHRAIREMLGAFVLGQLSGAEHAAVQAHVDGCAACRAEIAELAPLVPALRGVDPERLGALPSPPAGLGERVLTSIRQGRQQHVRRTLVTRVGSGLLVAAALAGAFFLGARLTPDAEPVAGPRVIALDVRLAVDGVQADAGLVRHTWGTELKLEATGLEDGGAYTVTFIRNDGTEVPGGTFLGTGGNAVRCSLNAALPLDDASRVTITDEVGAVVLDADVA